jgi:hypothetical protein
MTGSFERPAKSVGSLGEDRMSHQRLRLKSAVCAARGVRRCGTGTVASGTALNCRNNLREAQMQARYFIVRNQDAWLIMYGNQEFGPYQSQSEAMMFAIEAAKNLEKKGEEADVCLMGENGHFRSEWSTAEQVRP